MTGIGFAYLEKSAKEAERGRKKDQKGKAITITEVMEVDRHRHHYRRHLHRHSNLHPMYQNGAQTFTIT